MSVYQDELGLTAERGYANNSGGTVFPLPDPYYWAQVSMPGITVPIAYQRSPVSAEEAELRAWQFIEDYFGDSDPMQVRRNVVQAEAERLRSEVEHARFCLDNEREVVARARSQSYPGAAQSFLGGVMRTMAHRYRESQQRYEEFITEHADILKVSEADD